MAVVFRNQCPRDAVEHNYRFRAVLPEHGHDASFNDLGLGSFPGVAKFALARKLATMSAHDYLGSSGQADSEGK
jgi:hypothetical protein